MIVSGKVGTRGQISGSAALWFQRVALAGRPATNISEDLSASLHSEARRLRAGFRSDETLVTTQSRRRRAALWDSILTLDTSLSGTGSWAAVPVLLVRVLQRKSYKRFLTFCKSVVAVFVVVMIVKSLLGLDSLNTREICRKFFLFSMAVL